MVASAKKVSSPRLFSHKSVIHPSFSPGPFCIRELRQPESHFMRIKLSFSMAVTMARIQMMNINIHFYTSALRRRNFLLGGLLFGVFCCPLLILCQVLLYISICNGRKKKELSFFTTLNSLDGFKGPMVMRNARQIIQVDKVC